MYKFMFLFLQFFFYSVLGFIIEIISCTLVTKKITFSRGYLLGPYIPIFGFGAIIMVNFLDKYKDDLLILFILSMIVCCLVEYFTSLLLEKIFKLRWWDYSHESFNVNGRICLKNGVLFGLGGLVITKYFNPLLLMFLNAFSMKTIIIVGSILFGIIILDTIISTFTISKLKINTKKYLNKDATSVVKLQVAQSLDKYSIFYKRIFHAFPHIKLNTNIVKLREFMDEFRKNNIKNK
ncbi:MAG: putative ABC transporter permease [Bacilli bacterium]|nr:putative ABC transporter permease [Bacilli bacterium]